jgi:hypothetical protein
MSIWSISWYAEACGCVRDDVSELVKWCDVCEQDTYLGDISTSPNHTLNYLRLFQELNAHSVYHLLRHIEQPTLVVSGLLDVLTPAYQSMPRNRRTASILCRLWVV